MAPLVTQDAAHQAELLIKSLDSRAEFAAYRDRLREADRGPPAEGATQWTIVHAYDDARKAARVKTNWRQPARLILWCERAMLSAA
jgi:hypothetical protein